SSPKGPEFRRKLLSIFLIWAAAIIFTVVYVSHETPGYFWDYFNYWKQLIDITSILKSGDIQLFASELIQSLRTSDYNISPILPLIPVSIATQGSRLGFIAGLVAVHLVPATLVLSFMTRECWKGVGKQMPIIATLGLFILYPNFWGVTMLGYPDIAGLVPLGLAAILILRTEWLTQANRRESGVIGLLFWATFLLRRHFAYTILATIIMTVVFAGITILRQQKRRPHKMFAGLIQNLVILAGSFLVPAILVQGPLILKVLNTSYGDLYSAYQADWQTNLQFFYSLNGPLWSLLLLSGIVYSLTQRNLKGLFCLLTGLLSYVLFQRVQTPNPHHCLAFALWFLPVAAWPLHLICKQATAVRRLWFEWLLIGLMFVVSMPALAWPRLAELPLFKWSQPLSPGFKFPPFRLTSYETVQAIANQFATDEYRNKKIWVLASSTQLNASMLDSINYDHLNRIRFSGDVDKRDGFQAAGALSADYAVTTSKPATHLRPEDQQVVVIPNQALLDPQSPLRQLFTPISHPPYKLADGSSVLLFKRTSGSSQPSIEWLEKQFQKVYPDWKYHDGVIGPGG
ncbi:MAG: hypothetical protein ACK54Z_02375, partial [Cyanobacteriota bacterium]